MENQAVTGENKMGVMPVGRLLISMSVPMMLSMLVQALYNIVDSMFVAQLNENALTAVSLAFPLQNLMIAVSSGTGVGVNATVSKALGEKNQEYANRAANTGIWLAGASFVGFAAFILLFGRAFYTIQTDNAQILKYGVDYIYVIGLMSFGLFFQMIFERLLQSTGKTIFSMWSQMIGAVINIILDPIMIFGLLGFPRMEVAGAALATVSGQIIAAFIGYYFNRKKNKELHISPFRYRPTGKLVKRIYSVGVPSIIMMSIGSLMTFGMNKILMGFTSTATAVFGVYFKLQSFIFMPVFGMNNGLIPIIAYNFGARRADRITKTIKLGILYATLIMILGFAVFQVFPAPLLGIFNASQDMLAIGIPALRMISYSFLLAGFGIISSSVFQAMGHGVLSLTVSVLRQLILILPAAYILARISGLTYIWLSFPIADIGGAVASYWFLRYIFRRDIRPLKQESAQE